MKIDLCINGKKVEAFVNGNKLAKALKKNTGYETPECPKGLKVWSEIYKTNDGFYHAKCCTMYSDKTVTENNLRAYRLIMNLQAFAAQHGGCAAGRRKTFGSGYIIEMFHNEICVREVWAYGILDLVVFTTRESAEEAIKVFHDELLWFFTKYDPMPEGWWPD